LLQWLNTYYVCLKIYILLQLKQIVNAVFGGTSVGLGIGVIVLAGGTTAGTTILARIATVTNARSSEITVKDMTTTIKSKKSNA
jgi:uncharacterized membrane-anchored protein YitT (DUF2179 family)